MADIEKPLIHKIFWMSVYSYITDFESMYLSHDPIFI